ncbi:DUF4062 domain-containing protein [Methanosarcina sp. Mfa9]|uniref:DUF4062 domain-containing protein n=1 Tax=Methanosarcina sp. Mfa9 TaxID=3439063 RepID=UPI003F87E48C
MARPRVFVSSTYYDLKYIRSSLENFIYSLGFEPILHEKGQIPYSSEDFLDESCYKEVENADIFIIIIGGRYGSEKSGSKEKKEKQFFDRYDSITMQEYRKAVERGIPTYILIEKSVYSEFETFLKNKNNESINYAHVDSVNIFNSIENILSQTKPIHQFDRYSDIEAWLKEQWAGLFRDLINQRSKQIQIDSLASQVDSLTELNETLRKYLEEVVPKISPESKDLISNESMRLKNFEQDKKIANTLLYSFVRGYGVLVDDLKDALLKSKSFDDFIEKIRDKMDPVYKDDVPSYLCEYEWIIDINEARKMLDVDPFIVESTQIQIAHEPNSL